MPEFFLANGDVVIRLSIALVLGMVIGAERLFVHKDAGMKTHALVSVGSALFVIISEMMAAHYSALGDFDPTRMASQIIVGIGFLGAGSIMVYGSQIRGLATAGGLWVTAGIGMAAGFQFYDLAVIAALIVLFIFVVVNMFEKPIRKISRDAEAL